MNNMERPEISGYSARERILIVEVNWMGDVLFSTPAIRAIRKKHPGAFIAVLVVPRCKDVFFGNNYLDEVIVLDEEGRHNGFWGKVRLIRDLRVRRFSVAYLFHRSLTRALCVFLSGIRARIGYDNKKSSFLLTERVSLPGSDIHRSDMYYYLISKTTVPAGEGYYDFFVSLDNKMYINEMLKKLHLDPSKKMAVLHVGGNWELKLWAKENFAKLIDVLIQQMNFEVVISGSFMDYKRAQDIASLANSKPHIACGLTTLQQLGALFQKAEFVISADSGPMHIAVAVGARTLALFGPTSPRITGPLGRGDFFVIHNPVPDPSCIIPCYNLDCGDNSCMGSITVDQVLQEMSSHGWLK